MIYGNHKLNREYGKLSLKTLQILWAQTIGKPYSQRYLLSKSVKVIKGEKMGWITGVLYAPAATKFQGGHTCSHSELARCAGPCLVHSGHMALDGAVNARADRLQLLIKDPALWFEILSRECARLKRRARARGYRVAGRLNGTTDLDWTRILFDGKSVFQRIKGITWYDYTKNPKLAESYVSAGISVTFSWYDKASASKVLDLLDRGVNIAIAYKDKLPETQKIGGRTIRVIDGDQSDLRFKDCRGVVVGLKYKFATMSKDAAEINARALQSGFIIQSNTEIQ